MARFPSLPAWTTAFVTTLAVLNTIIPSVQAAEPETIKFTTDAGVTQTLLVDRTPALFTGDFGDCMGGQSLLNLTSFDAAYYADNMTVLFNLAGTSNLKNESLMCESFHWSGVLSSSKLTFITVHIAVEACE